MGTSTVIAKVQCPECAKKGSDRHKDNLAIYNDGHEWCFACGYYRPPTNIIKARRMFNTDEKINEDEGSLQNLPEDCIPAGDSIKALNLLLMYGISKNDSAIYDLKWSESKQLLIYHTPKFWSGKYLGENKGHPKTISSGTKFDDKLITIFNQCAVGDKIVLVEDFISAIRVGKVCATVCLFGCSIPQELLIRLSERFKHLRIWLDMDKARKSLLDNSRAKQMGFDTVQSIITTRDPKAYSVMEIKDYVA